MTTDILATGLIYTTLGLAVAIVWVYVLNKAFLGGFWGALIVAIIGAFSGAIIEIVFADAISLLSDIAGVNIFPALASAIVLISLFSYACNRGSDADEEL